MKLLRNLRVGARLTVAFGAIVAIFCLVVLTVWVTGNRMAEAERWNLHSYRVMAAGDDMLKAMLGMETSARGFLIAGDERLLGGWEQGRQRFQSAWEEARRLTAADPAQQRRLEAITAQRETFVAAVQSTLAARREVTAGARTLDDFVAQFAQGRDQAAMDEFRRLDAEMMDAERALLAERSATAERLRRIATLTELLGPLVAALLVLALGWTITRSVTAPLAQAAEVARRIRDGDLTQPVPPGGRDEPGQLLDAMREMQTALAALVGDVRGNAESVSSASSQIAQGNLDLSQRTEEQASALQQTAATMEQLGSTARLNADAAQRANALAQDASQVAVRGGAVVGEVVSTMRGISDSSRRIAEIIGTIDGIAFQTNILALNAAVEPARAGEQGRGFAVVASEVRSLAQRSADAAREIKDLISDSVERVEQGTALVDQAGGTMDEVVGAIRRVTELVAEISAASLEQGSGVQQVGDAVGQMDRTTQQNAALVEESAAAAASLRQQARALLAAVSVFRTAGGAAALSRA